MLAQFTAIYEKGEKYYIGYCPEVPGANGQGETLEECRESLKEAIKLILQDRLEDTLRGIPENAIKETVVIEWKEKSFFATCDFMDVFLNEKGRGTLFIKIPLMV